MRQEDFDRDWEAASKELLTGMKAWRSDNLKICKRGELNTLMTVETVLSMLTLVSHFKKVMHRKWAHFKSRLAYTMAMFDFAGAMEWSGR